ncbi:hypothetical protein EVAR_80857_1 [Eumeta japonica]|uniref:Uncharacterized protein n=1 Tax=Eumeta variegata TaxID=151549 RepID=A0A4C1V033_EUMVA|nr:hypothetical protein EVAR_80857_1 [Eumeta japonica]
MALTEDRSTRTWNAGALPRLGAPNTAATARRTVKRANGGNGRYDQLTTVVRSPVRRGERPSKAETLSLLSSLEDLFPQRLSVLRAMWPARCYLNLPILRAKAVTLIHLRVSLFRVLVRKETQSIAVSGACRVTLLSHGSPVLQDPVKSWSRKTGLSYEHGCILFLYHSYAGYQMKWT